MNGLNLQSEFKWLRFMCFNGFVWMKICVACIHLLRCLLSCSWVGEKADLNGFVLCALMVFSGENLCCLHPSVALFVGLVRKQSIKLCLFCF